MSNDVFRQVISYIPEQMLSLNDRKNLALTCKALYHEHNVTGPIKQKSRKNIGLMTADVLGFSTSPRVIRSNIYSDITQPSHAIKKYDELDQKIASLPFKLTLLRTVLRSKLTSELEDVERDAASARFMKLVKEAQDKSYAPRDERRNMLSDVLKSAKPLDSQSVSYLYVHRTIDVPEHLQQFPGEQVHIHESFPVMPFKGIDDFGKSMIRNEARYGLRKM